MKLFQKMLIAALALVLAAGEVSMQEPLAAQASAESARAATRKITLKKITLNKKKLTVAAGSSKKLAVKTLPGKAKVAWKSSNTRVATVKNGKITGVSVGTATITASSGAKKATCKVTVVWGQKAKKAIKAYQKLAGQNQICWNPEVEPKYREYRKVDQFMLADINRDGIPELLVECMGPHANGYAAVYHYYNGKAVQGARQDSFTCYYPSSGILVSETVQFGCHTYYYKVAKGKKITLLANSSTEIGGGNPDYYQWQGKNLTKASFDKKLKKTAGKKKVMIKNSNWHKNTAANRKNMAKSF